MKTGIHSEICDGIKGGQRAFILPTEELAKTENPAAIALHDLGITVTFLVLSVPLSLVPPLLHKLAPKLTY